MSIIERLEENRLAKDPIDEDDLCLSIVFVGVWLLSLAFKVSVAEGDESEQKIEDH